MATITGTAGNDTISGTNLADSISGLEGDDTMNGGNGADRLSGGPGDDALIGWAGADTLIGGSGDDYLVGDVADSTENPIVESADVIYGGSGNDSLQGNGGNDRLDGGDGNDSLDGGNGSDRLIGGRGDDLISDWSGSNTATGNDGNDQLTGVGKLFGDAGDDGIYGSGLLGGGAGNDWLGANPSASAAEMNGGTGTDRFYVQFAGQDGVAQHVTIDDFKPAEGDKLEAHAYVSGTDGDQTGFLFAGFDTNHDGVVRGDGSDMFSANTARGLELHYFEDTMALKGVDHINAADWVMG
jgi:Ca2+-binding RTX toxin-like protein